jgi:hypothetical protein
MFAFSGADGPTNEGCGFVGLLLPERYAVQFNSGSATVRMGLEASFQNNGTLVAASSDVIIVADSQDKGDADSPAAMVLAYQQWDLLVGYAPVVTLEVSDDVSGIAAVCNVTGKWVDDKKGYDIVETAGGKFTATAEKPISWKQASGAVSSAGAGNTITITFDNGKV